MRRMTLRKNKTLKLKNVLVYKVMVQKEDMDISKVVEEMHSYIKSKNITYSEKVIQYKKEFFDTNNILNTEIAIMIPCDKYISKVEEPYLMETVIVIKNMMKCSFAGKESEIKYAIDKINVNAFESEIELSDGQYTVYIDNNRAENTIAADVFIPTKNSKSVYISEMRNNLIILSLFMAMCILGAKIVSIKVPIWFMLMVLILLLGALVLFVWESVIKKADSKENDNCRG